MPYTWKYYLLVAHLVDETGHTACNRMMAHFDDAVIENETVVSEQSETKEGQ